MKVVQQLILSLSHRQLERIVERRDAAACTLGRGLSLALHSPLLFGESSTPLLLRLLLCVLLFPHLIFGHSITPLTLRRRLRILPLASLFVCEIGTPLTLRHRLRILPLASLFVSTALARLSDAVGTRPTHALASI